MCVSERDVSSYLYFLLIRGFEIPLDIQDETDLSIELAVLQNNTFNVAIAPI